MTKEEREDAINYFKNKLENEVYGAKYNKLAIKALEQETTTKNDLVDDMLALLEKTYADFCSCEGGEGWLKIDGKEYNTDVGYAIEGMSIFVEVLKQRLAESEEQE